MGFRIGIDVGGTFTDFLLMGPGGRSAAHKELSTPADPSLAVMSGLGALAEGEAMPLARFLDGVECIVHGTTVTTNAVLTGGTARTGLITTRGFRDALQMRRGIREKMYDNRYHPPAPIVPRWLRLPATERVAADGALVTALDGGDVERAAARFLAEGVEAVAVCFLHAHANPRNERIAAEIVRRLMPRAYLSISSQVLPQVRFYERTSTTVLNAAVGPILARYLGNLTAKLSAARYRGALLVMQGERIAGIVTERDYARKIILMGRTSKETPVSDIMTSEVMYVRPDQTSDECMALMTENRIRHLPVVDHGKLIGLISIGDLVKDIISEQRFIIDQLEHYIRGER